MEPVEGMLKQLVSLNAHWIAEAVDVGGAAARQRFDSAFDALVAGNGSWTNAEGSSRPTAKGRRWRRWMTVADATKSNEELLTAVLAGMEEVCKPLGLSIDRGGGKGEGVGVVLPRLVQLRDELTAHAGQRLAWAVERVAAQGREFKHEEEALRDAHIHSAEERSKAKAKLLLVSSEGKTAGDGSEKNSGLSLAEFEAAMRESVGEERALLEVALEANGSVVERVDELGPELQQGSSAQALLQRRIAEYTSHVEAALAKSQEAALRLLRSYSERAETDGSFLDELLDGTSDGMGNVEGDVGDVDGGAQGTGGVAGVVSTAAAEANALVSSRLRRWTVLEGGSEALSEALGRGVQQLHSQLYALAAARLAARVGAWEQESRALYEACFVSPMRLRLQSEQGLPEVELAEKHEQQVVEAEERLLKRVAHILGPPKDNENSSSTGVATPGTAAGEIGQSEPCTGLVVRTTATSATVQAQAQAQAVVDAALARFRFDASAAFRTLTTDNENALTALGEKLVADAATRLRADVDEWWAVALSADTLPLGKNGDGNDGGSGTMEAALDPLARQARGTLQLELQTSPIGATTARGLRVRVVVCHCVISNRLPALICSVPYLL
jgi:hypothetical protein